jgi:17beta-estradiol 17-dehydrogenase / very-long-chain 3-oxoacyl-CoA reductase
MDAAIDFLQRVPQSVQLGLAAVGTLFLGAKLFNLLRMVLNTFVLSGVSVRRAPLIFACLSRTDR